MVRDTIVFGGLVLCFALALTSLLTIAYGLAKRRPRWRGGIVLLCPVLAPWWALREGMQVRAVCFLVGVFGYALLLSAEIFS